MAGWKEQSAVEIYSVKDSEIDLLYSQTEEQDVKNGCIGHLRGDFGSGKEFYTTWWPHQGNRLNQEAFKKDLNRVMDLLRQKNFPLKDLNSMNAYCLSNSNAAFGLREGQHGYRIETERFQYMLRCFPHRGDYNFYLYCYDKEERTKERGSAHSKKKSEPER